MVMARLEACGVKVGQVAISSEQRDDGMSFELDFNYSNEHHFHWTGDLAHGSAHLEADFGTGRTILPTAVSLLSPEAALGEAMFL